MLLPQKWRIFRRSSQWLLPSRKRLNSSLWPQATMPSWVLPLQLCLSGSSITPEWPHKRTTGFFTCCLLSPASSLARALTTLCPLFKSHLRYLLPRAAFPLFLAPRTQRGAILCSLKPLLHLALASALIPQSRVALHFHFLSLTVSWGQWPGS